MIISPLPKALSSAMDKVLGVLAVIVVSPILVVAWLLDWTEDRFWPDNGEWQRWFAWFPVRVGLGISAPLVWMERVDRTRYQGYRFYRRIGDTATFWPWQVSDEQG